MTFEKKRVFFWEKNMLNGLLKVTFVGLILWGAVTWLGAGFTALGIATLAVLLATMGLDSANRHTTELK